MTMMTTAASLDRARSLRVPSREEMLRRDHKVYEFWGENEQLLEKAWEEWEANDKLAATLSTSLDSSILDPALRNAVEEAWKDPSKETEIFKLWKEVSPGVYQCQFFDPDKIHILRSYLDTAADAGIPLRPPYGIVLNRGGFMIDSRSNGYFAMPKFQTFYQDLMDSYIRPLGRLFFSDYIRPEDDSETFGFSIRYEAGKDQSIRQHTDGSSFTFNVNLNLPKDSEEDYTGSSLYFVDPSTGQKNAVTFQPGVAVMHLGAIPHAALPITSGERSNLVLWLYGRGGRRSGARVYNLDDQLSSEERWTKPNNDGSWNLPKDNWAPF